MPSIPLTTGPYTILPLCVPATAAYPHETSHYLYVRQHAPRIEDADTPRSLFVANLPIDATEGSLRKLFAAQLGGARVESVDFDGLRSKKSGSIPIYFEAGQKRKRNADDVPQELELPAVWDREILKSGSSAVVVFVDRASAESALKHCKKAAKTQKEVRWTPEDGLGEKRYLTHHTLRYPPKPILQSRVNNYMAAYHALETARSRTLSKQRNLPDEDGFVTVTRGGRVGPARLEETQAVAKKLKERQKNAVKDDFYRFQTREKRKEREAELRKGFEEDRRRVEEMRRRRGAVRPE
ncbi:hypothetical protein H2199_001067 [Coniosporium tulheliwenetii]|uniref:Uncharacterized protein n=1 Tax=Coniosporium tulheliwenetii TaxID=3383036 RepID=A0ACC2ZKZ5_9PEZI|nr:hypothetical protein H2199_001067 [Cladosporium sp. JES 115]